MIWLVVFVQVAGLGLVFLSWIVGWMLWQAFLCFFWIVMQVFSSIEWLLGLIQGWVVDEGK